MKQISIISFLFISIFYSSCNEENPPTPIEEINPDACYYTPDSTYLSCVRPKDSTTLDIATWNIEFFPKTNNTLENLDELITNFNADVIAVQEITSASEFSTLDELLPNWEAQLFVSSGLNVGFLYNTCEIQEITDIKALNIGDNYPFPREPVEVTLTHQNGLQVTLINIHLKCCSNGFERRVAASQLLESYIAENYPDDNVLLLGDFNDEIDDQASPFYNFIQNDAEYKFADMEIALGPESEYSFPSWPSHIDHLLITNELFDNVNYTETVKFKDCFSMYDNIISDHRPVMISLSPDN
ncbi:MAG: endonuclease/exonuclease/phosphatase family protein [Candidatus Cyclobacteriaceae bacterium M2_1C_046]